MRDSKAERILLGRITTAARQLQDEHRTLHIGQLLALVRRQLGMSQRDLACRTGIPQPMVSKIENGRHNSRLDTLEKLARGLECELVIGLLPRKSPDEIRWEQAERKARGRMQYLRGTMALEEQQPSNELLEELTRDEVRRLLEGGELWDDQL